MAAILVNTLGDKVNLVDPSDSLVFIPSGGHLMVGKADLLNPGKLWLELKASSPSSCNWVTVDLMPLYQQIHVAKAPDVSPTMICDYSIHVTDVTPLDPRVVVEPPRYAPVIVNVDGTGHGQVDAKPGLEPPGSSMMLQLGGALAIFLLALLVGYLLGKTKG